MKKILKFEVEKKSLLKDFLKENISKKFYKNLRFKKAEFLNNGKLVRTWENIEKGLLEIIYEEEEKEIEWEYLARPLKIIYEDEHYLVINKEEGILTIPTKAEPRSVYQQLLYYFRKQNIDISILNRLDKGTSGLILVAKDRYSAYLLQPTKDKIKRSYIALVDGILTGSGKIDKYIIKDSNSNKRLVAENGIKAITYYESLEIIGNRTKVKLDLETGRTHQIRVHLSDLGYPIVGDILYGGSKYDRICLESIYLEFIDPYTKELRIFRIGEEF